MLAALVIAVAFATSLWLRWPAFVSDAATPNMEASYHALWTAEALTGSPASSHKLLPTVTLAPRPGNDVTWGATQPTSGGSYIYASFPPFAFWMATPFAALRVAPVDLLPLALFNSLIGLLAAVLLAGLARRVFLDRAEAQGTPKSEIAAPGWLLFASVAGVTLLLSESLQSHGVVYWPHSPAQVVFISGAWFAYSVFKRGPFSPSTPGLLTCCAIYPLLEWSGYIFNAGLFITFALMNFRARDIGEVGRSSSRWSVSAILKSLNGWPTWIAAVTVAVGVATLVHLVSAIGVSNALDALGSRAVARATSLDVMGLPLGYLTSLGLLVPAGVLAAWLGLRPSGGRPAGSFGYLFLATAFPSLENLLMLEHAIEFSFDRLKIIVPLILALAYWVGGIPTGTVLIALPLAAVAIIANNVALYRDREAQAAVWVEVNQNNQRLIAQTQPALSEPCAVIGASDSVRGYLNLIVGRDIYERMDAETLAEKAKEREACAAFLITTRATLTDLPQVISITRLEISRRAAPRSPPPRPPASPPA